MALQKKRLKVHFYNVQYKSEQDIFFKITISDTKISGNHRLMHNLKGRIFYFKTFETSLPKFLKYKNQAFAFWHKQALLESYVDRVPHFHP